MPKTTASAPSGDTIEEILSKQGLLTGDQISALKQESLNSGTTIDQLILQHNLVPQDKITQAKAQILNVPFIKLEGKAIAADILSLVPEPAARRYKTIPFEKTGDELWVAMEDPLDIQIIQFIEKRSGLRVRPYLALPEDIIKAINDQYSQNLTSEVTSALREVQAVKPEEAVAAGPEVVREAPVSNIINELLEYAVKVRASDIHIEPQENRTRVRYRIDGILQEKILLPKGVHDALVSRIKILFTLQLDEK